MIGAALQRLGIALILVGGVDQLTKAAAWEIGSSNVLLTIGLGLVVIGLLVAAVERVTRDTGTGTGPNPDEAARPDPGQR